MTLPLPPDVIHRLDQESAAANHGLDDLIAGVRKLLADRVDPNVAAQLLAIAFLKGQLEPGRAFTALGYALVRLATQDGGAQP